MHLAEGCYTSNSRSVIHEVYNFNEVQQGNFWYGEEKSDLVILKNVEKTYTKKSFLRHLTASQPIFYFHISDTLGEELLLLQYHLLGYQYKMLWKPDKWVCVSKSYEIWNHTHSNILALKKIQLDKMFVSYLNSHSILDLLTTNFKLSSVASNCGISILPKCTGEDNDDRGKLDLHVYLDNQLSSLC